jgi:hypothetical protein
MIEMNEEEKKEFWAWFFNTKCNHEQELFKLSCAVGQFEAVEEMKRIYLKEKEDLK